MSLQDELDAKSEAKPVERTDTLVYKGDAYRYESEYFASGLNRLPILVFSNDSGERIHLTNGHNTRLKHISPGSGDVTLEIDGLNDRDMVEVSKKR